VRGEDIGGIGVHIGARVSALASANDVLVSSTVRDLVIGSGLEFEDRGTHELKGRTRRMALVRRSFSVAVGFGDAHPLAEALRAGGGTDRRPSTGALRVRPSHGWGNTFALSQRAS
jgi:hypothetical protein